jgi:ABC-type nitrate/sulfonate/bicarbonate transport system ATPase subunit
MVFQHYSLCPWLRVMENIKFCRRLKVVPDTLRGDADVEVASGRAEVIYLAGRVVLMAPRPVASTASTNCCCRPSATRT